MPRRRVHGEGTYAHYVTFSCYKRRRFLSPDVCKRVVIGTLGSQLARQNGICAGFVIMVEYMHNNPVRAGLVGAACEWPWSSARFWLAGQAGGHSAVVAAVREEARRVESDVWGAASCAAHPPRWAGPPAR